MRHEGHRDTRELLLFALLLTFSGCGDSTGPTPKTPAYCDLQSGTDPIQFSSENFEFHILRALGPPLTCDRALLITDLFLVGATLTTPPILTLEGIQNFPNLERLSLNLDVELDPAPLGVLQELKRVVITCFNSVPLDLGPLGLLRKLEALEIHGCRSDDVSPLGDITSLRTLNLDGNGIVDAAPLARLQNLFTLSLRGNDISDVSALRGMGGLRQLWLSSNGIHDIPPLIGSPELESLELDDNQISDVRGVSDLTKLVSLQLSQNSIQDLSPLAGLTATRWLGLRENRIRDVTDLSEMTAVEVLRLDRNALTDIAGLEALISLSQLRLTGNTDLVVIDPLLTNTGIGPGDAIWLDSTSVSCESANALRAKGAVVVWYRSC